MQAIDYVITIGFCAVLMTAMNPFNFRNVKRKQLETCRCFYCN